MKNNFIKFLLFFVVSIQPLLAEPFKFDTSKIEIIDNTNKILATDGIAYSNDNDLEIHAKKFEYDKNLNLLKAFGGFVLIKSDNIKIEFNEMKLDQNVSILSANGNVKIYDSKQKSTLKTQSITYQKDLSIIESDTDSTFEDKFQNIITTKKFYYDLNKNIIKISDANLKDIGNNNFKIELAFINTISNKLYGKDISIDLNNKSFNKENEPRLKGNSIVHENDKTIVGKGIFTTCKRRDGCPPWELSAKEIEHNKKKQIINYKNAWLKIYDIPVMYFPKFFHPDPTVERKSGFLIPTIKSSSNSKSFLNLPYYKVLGINKDMTITPRFYTEDKILLQTEYRQVNSNSNHFNDISYSHEKNNAKNHLFYRYDRMLDLAYFDESKLDIKVEKTSNDTYLRSNKLKSPLIEDYNILENSLGLNFYSNNLSIDTEFLVYENLNKSNNDRYEYIFPRFDLVKNLENKSKLNGNFLFKSSNLVRSYQTNILEKTNINDLIFNSNPKISNYGFYNNYDFIVKNVNSNAQNSNKFKDNSNYYLSSLLQFNSSLPLMKETNSFQKVLKPKASLKISPNNNKDLSADENRLDVDNLFNLNRLSSNDTLEGGISISYGSDFGIFDKIDSREIFGLKLASNSRLEENKDLPKGNQIGQKTSNLFGEVLYSPSEFLITKYQASTKNDFYDVNYENFEATISINNFVTTFDYINENNTIKSNSYLENTTTYNFNDTNNVLFSTRRNKKTDLTEYYNFMYQYKNDCLAASIEYNKDYYNDRDIKPEENIFFKLTIIPFGETSSPNLKN